MNLVFEQKLNKLHQAIIIANVCPIIFLIAIVWVQVVSSVGGDVQRPPTTLYPILIGTAFLWFFADFCFVGAYTSGGNMMTVTTIFLLFPVVGAIMKYVYTRDMPTIYHMVGWVVAVVAVLLVTKGEMINKASS